MIGGARGSGPFPPMGRMNIQRRARGGLDPAAKNTATWKHDGMGAIKVNNSNFQVPLERRGFNLKPCHVANAD
jgi:hypothetical protein